MSQEPALEPSADAEAAGTQNAAPANRNHAPHTAGTEEVKESVSEKAEGEHPSQEVESHETIMETDAAAPISEVPREDLGDMDENEGASEVELEGDAIHEPGDPLSDTDKLIRKAKSTTVADMNACGDAGKLIRKLTLAVKQTKEELAPLKSRLSTAKKEFQEAESNRLKPLVEAEKLVKSSIELFLTEESARRRHQRELQELARQESIAEREKKIETLEEEGKIEEARTLANEYPPELPPAQPIPVPKMISAKATRRSEVSDLHALIRFVAEHPEHSDLLRPSTPKLNAMAKKTPGESPLPGVEFLTIQKVTSK